MRAAAARGVVQRRCPIIGNRQAPAARDILDIGLRTGTSCRLPLDAQLPLGFVPCAIAMHRAPATAVSCNACSIHSTRPNSIAPNTSIRNIGTTSANSTAVAPSSACASDRWECRASHWVSTRALRLIVPLATKPKLGNSGRDARLAVIVTNWPPTPPPAAGAAASDGAAPCPIPRRPGRAIATACCHCRC